MPLFVKAAQQLPKRQRAEMEDLPTERLCCRLLTNCISVIQFDHFHPFENHRSHILNLATTTEEHTRTNRPLRFLLIAIL